MTLLSIRKPVRLIAAALLAWIGFGLVIGWLMADVVIGGLQ